MTAWDAGPSRPSCHESIRMCHCVTGSSWYVRAVMVGSINIGCQSSCKCQTMRGLKLALGGRASSLACWIRTLRRIYQNVSAEAIPCIMLQTLYSFALRMMTLRLDQPYSAHHCHTGKAYIMRAVTSRDLSNVSRRICVWLVHCSALLL